MATPPGLFPTGWGGDPRELIAHSDDLASDFHLCEELFASKQEAFGNGLFIGEVRIPDHERRHLWGAIAVAFRRAHMEGLIEPPETLRNELTALPYSDIEIDDAFTALVALDGTVCGRSFLLEDVTHPYDRLLAEHGLVENQGDQLCFTDRGNDMVKLLEAYGRSKQRWRSLVYPTGSTRFAELDKASDLDTLIAHALEQERSRRHRNELTRAREGERRVREELKQEGDDHAGQAEA